MNTHADAGLYPLTLYYDAQCPVCNTEITNLRLRDAAGRLRLVDASAPGFDALPAGTTRDDLMRSMHAVRADGRIVHGVAAIRLAYAAVGMGWVTALTLLPGVRPLVEALYPVFARHRRRVPAALVKAVFALASRRAAEAAAARSPCRDGACERRGSV